jgi:hypothetical protein
MQNPSKLSVAHSCERCNACKVIIETSRRGRFWRKFSAENNAAALVAAI